MMMVMRDDGLNYHTLQGVMERNEEKDRKG